MCIFLLSLRLILICWATYQHLSYVHEEFLGPAREVRHDAGERERERDDVCTTAARCVVGEQKCCFFLEEKFVRSQFGRVTYNDDAGLDSSAKNVG